MVVITSSCRMSDQAVIYPLRGGFGHGTSPRRLESALSPGDDSGFYALNRWIQLTCGPGIHGEQDVLGGVLSSDGVLQQIAERAARWR
jgi:hypothetical protein